MAQSSKQLINTASIFVELGKIDQARKIARRLIAQHSDRLSVLSKVTITDGNNRAVFDELSEIQYLTGN